MAELIKSYLNFCNYRRHLEEKGKIDLTNRRWFYPTELLPLGDLLYSLDKKFYKLPVNPHVKNYFILMTDQSSSKGLSYIPIHRVHRFTEEDDNDIYDLIVKKCKTDQKNPFKLLIAELTTNVNEHSQCSNSSFMAQRYNKNGFVEMVFFDNGITIPGSLRNSGKDDGKSDANLIVKAINGLSSKSDERGFGLQESIRIITVGCGGEVFIVSGSGAFYTNKEKITPPYREIVGKAFKLDSYQELNGTLISFVLPLPIPDKINLDGIL